MTVLGRHFYDGLTILDLNAPKRFSRQSGFSRNGSQDVPGIHLILTADANGQARHRHPLSIPAPFASGTSTHASGPLVTVAVPAASIHGTSILAAGVGGKQGVVLPGGKATASLSEAERDAVWGGNACRVYGIGNL